MTAVRMVGLVLKNEVLSAWVICKKASHVEDFAAQGHIARVRGLVLLELGGVDGGEGRHCGQSGLLGRWGSRRAAEEEEEAAAAEAVNERTAQGERRLRRAESGLRPGRMNAGSRNRERWCEVRRGEWQRKSLSG